MHKRRARDRLGVEEETRAEEQPGAEAPSDRRVLEERKPEDQADGPDQQLRDEGKRAEEAEQGVGRGCGEPPRKRTPRDPQSPVQAARDSRAAAHAPWQQAGDEEL